MKRILYVEDDPLIAKLYSEKLTDAGFEVYVAEDGLAAVRYLAQLPIDLVVLDLLMPKMTGADVLKFMREKPELRNVRVIVFSNSFLSHLTEQVNVSKVEATLVKSNVTPSKLIDAVNNVLLAPPAGMRAGAPPSPAGVTNPLPTTADALQPLPPLAGPVRSEPPPDNSPAPQDRAQKDFFGRAPVILKSLREICAGFLDAADSAVERRRLEDLARKVSFLSQMTSLAGAYRLAHLSSALEALLFELHDKPGKINDSARQTVVSAIVFLADQLASTPKRETTQPPPPSVLVVDDDAVSNRALVMALNRANLRATSAADPFVALKMVEKTPYDLVMLDIDMPGMDGITLCQKIRGLPDHARTPVIFVTGMQDFKLRAKSLLSGGSDLISKPILPLELTVKVITHLTRNAPVAAPV